MVRDRVRVPVARERGAREAGDGDDPIERERGCGCVAAVFFRSARRGVGGGGGDAPRRRDLGAGAGARGPDRGRLGGGAPEASLRGSEAAAGVAPEATRARALAVGGGAARGVRRGARGENEDRDGGDRIVGSFFRREGNEGERRASGVPPGVSLPRRRGRDREEHPRDRGARRGRGRRGRRLGRLGRLGRDGPYPRGAADCAPLRGGGALRARRAAGDRAEAVRRARVSARGELPPRERRARRENASALRRGRVPARGVGRPRARGADGAEAVRGGGPAREARGVPRARRARAGVRARRRPTRGGRRGRDGRRERRRRGGARTRGGRERRGARRRLRGRARRGSQGRDLDGSPANGARDFGVRRRVRQVRERRRNPFPRFARFAGFHRRRGQIGAPGDARGGRRPGGVLGPRVRRRGARFFFERDARARSRSRRSS